MTDILSEVTSGEENPQVYITRIMGGCRAPDVTATQPTLDFAGPGRHHGAASTDTERAAAAPDRSDLRRRVLDAFMAAGPGGLTDEECSVRASIQRAHSAATRRAELMKRGVPIVDSGRRRATSSGRSSIVWIYAP